MRVIIIEDEKITANNLIENINEIRPDYKVINVLKSVAEAEIFFNKNHDFDLIFSDIQLGDGLSFEIFKKVNIKVPVIFCTAFDEYALDAFNANGIDYVLKPFDSKMVENAIEKYESFTQKNDNSINKLLQYINKNSYENSNQSILIYQNDKIIPINTNDIAVLQLIDGIVKIITFNGNYYNSSKSLEDFEKYKNQNFFRANRQFTVNRRVVRDASQYFNRKLLLNLNIKLQEQIFISKERTSAFLLWLEKI